MSKRLSHYQARFLRELADMPMYSETVQTPLSLTFLPDWIWGRFGSDGEVRTWLYKLDDRGLIDIEKDYFYRITELGLEMLEHYERTHQPTT